MYRHRRETHEHCNTLGSFLSTIQKRSHSNIRAQNYQARSKCLCFKTVLLFSVLQKRWRWGASFLFSFFVRLVLLVRKTTWFFSSLLLKLSTLNAVQREFLISFIISLISNDTLCIFGLHFQLLVKNSLSSSTSVRQLKTFYKPRRTLSFHWQFQWMLETSMRSLSAFC